MNLNRELPPIGMPGNARRGRFPMCWTWKLPPAHRPAGRCWRFAILAHAGRRPELPILRQSSTRNQTDEESETTDACGWVCCLFAALIGNDAGRAKECDVPSRRVAGGGDHPRRARDGARRTNRGSSRSATASRRAAGSRRPKRIRPCCRHASRMAGMTMKSSTPGCPATRRRGRCGATGTRSTVT